MCEAIHPCSQVDIRYALSIVGGRWKALIICELSRRNGLRYCEIAEAIPDLTHRVLTYELRFLERSNIVERLPPAPGKRRVIYALTERGRSLEFVIRSLSDWARSQRGEMEMF